MSELNDLIEYIKNLSPETEAESIKTYLLNYKLKQSETKEQNETKEQSETKEQDENLINKITVKNIVKLSKIYEYYKNKLITKKQKEEIKDYLLNNNYIKAKTNKNDKIMYYSINKEKIKDFIEWIKQNLIFED